MLYERYSIHVNDDDVLIYGSLTIREAFDFLSFFDQQGFNCLEVGKEESTLHLSKSDVNSNVQQKKQREKNYSESKFEVLYAEQLEKNKSLMGRILDMEAVSRQLVSEHNEKMDQATKTRNKLFSKLALQSLQQDPEVQKILSPYLEEPDSCCFEKNEPNEKDFIE